MATSRDATRLQELHDLADRNMASVVRHLTELPREAAEGDDHRVVALRTRAHEHLDAYFDCMVLVMAIERRLGERDPE